MKINSKEIYSYKKGHIYEVNKRRLVLFYEDKHVLIVFKPYGFLVHEDANESVNTMTNQVLSYLASKNELDLSRENTLCQDQFIV